MHEAGNGPDQTSWGLAGQADGTQTFTFNRETNLSAWRDLFPHLTDLRALLSLLCQTGAPNWILTAPPVPIAPGQVQITITTAPGPAWTWERAGRQDHVTVQAQADQLASLRARLAPDRGWTLPGWIASTPAEPASRGRYRFRQQAPLYYVLRVESFDTPQNPGGKPGRGISPRRPVPGPRCGNRSTTTSTASGGAGCKRPVPVVTTFPFGKDIP